jgi:hypothetical protein
MGLAQRLPKKHRRRERHAQQKRGHDSVRVCLRTGFSGIETDFNRAHEL